MTFKPGRSLWLHGGTVAVGRVRLQVVWSTGYMLVDWLSSPSVRLFSEFGGDGGTMYVLDRSGGTCDVQDYSLALGGVIRYLE